MEKYDRARRATDGHSACSLHAGYLRLQAHSEFVIIITFPRQQLFHERHSLLRCKYTACLFAIWEIPYLSLDPETRLYRDFLFSSVSRNGSRNNSLLKLDHNPLLLTYFDSRYAILRLLFDTVKSEMLRAYLINDRLIG